MNTRTLILPVILIVTTSFSGGVLASTARNADAQAQAAALLRRASVTPPAHIARSMPTQRVIADGHVQAAALLLGKAARSAYSIQQSTREPARRASDAQAHAATLLSGSRAR